MERLKRLKESILACTEAQVNGNLHQVDTKQLGQAVDMIKDLQEAMYYCTIVKAMEQQDKKQPEGRRGGEGVYYYTPGMYRPMRDDRYRDERYPDYYRKMQRERGIMFYDGPDGNGNSMGGRNDGSMPSGGNAGNNGGNGRNYYEHDPRYIDPNYPRWNDEPYYPPKEMRDYREGKSPMQRKMYMEGKQAHKKKEEQMKQLEKYMQDLSKDITEMIQDASPEQKQMLQQKMLTLSKMIN